MQKQEDTVMLSYPLFLFGLFIMLFPQSTAIAQSLISLAKTSPADKTPILVNVEHFNSNKPYVFEAHWESSIFSTQHELKQMVRYDNKISGNVPSDLDTSKLLEQKIEAGNFLGNIRFVLGSQSIATGGSKTSTAAGLHGKRTVYLWIGDTSYIGKEDETEFTNSLQWEVTYDLEIPSAMYQPLAIAGDERISLSWKKHSDADVIRYVVYWKKDSVDVSKNNYTKRESTSSTSYEITQGLTNNSTVAIAIAAVDEVGNEGELSKIILATPRSVYDFWELYQSQGGSEDGGYCFIATATFQNYSHPAVITFRVFRDSFLNQNSFGRNLIAWYYHYGKIIGAYIVQHSVLQSLMQAFLVILAVVVKFFLFHPYMFLILIILFAFMIISLHFELYLNRMKNRIFNLLLFLCISFATPSILAMTLSATSETATITSVKKVFSVADEIKKKNPTYSPVILWSQNGSDLDENVRPRWAFETKVTKYNLPLDQEAGISARDDIFHNDTTWFLVFGLEYQFWRAIGVLGLSMETGFYQFIGKGLYTDSLTPSKDSTTFTGIPIFASVIYRFDWLSNHWSIPLVPFFKAGFNYHLWWILNGKKEIAAFNSSSNELSIARGGSLGSHESLGVELSMDFFDQASARNFWVNVGVSNTYLTIEYQFIQNPLHTSKGFQFDSKELFAGVMFEF